MGSCMTTVKVPQNENTQNKPKTKPSTADVPKKTSIIPKHNSTSQLAESRDKLLAITSTLEALVAKLEVQAKALIERHKRGRSLFALKRMKLYSSLLTEVKSHLLKLENAILGQEEIPSNPKQLAGETQLLMDEIKEIMLLESPLPERETLKQREEKFKPLFNKYHIQTPDVYLQFAQFEAEVNEITLTTSTVFKKSDFDAHVIKADTDTLTKSGSDGLAKSDSDAPTAPNSEKDLDYAIHTSSEIPAC